MRHACARTLSTCSFLLLEQRLQLTPGPLCGLASWPLLGACFMYPGEKFLTLLRLAGPGAWRGVLGAWLVGYSTKPPHTAP